MKFTCAEPKKWSRVMSELAVGYIRVSTADQDRQSPERQYKHIMNYLKEMEWKFRKERLSDIKIELDNRVVGYTVRCDDPDKPDLEVVGFFTESKSGWRPDSRDVFNRMVEYVREYKIKHVFFAWVNRMARNFEDYIELKKRFRKVNEDVHLHFINDHLAFCPFEVDDYQDEERLEDILKRSKAESGEKSVRAKSARKEGFEEEKITYQLPSGYVHKIDPETRRPYVEIHPVHGERVKEIFKMMASGKYTGTTLAEELKTRGWQREAYSRKVRRKVLRPFSSGYLYNMFENETYLGKLKYKGKAKFSSIIPSIIDQDTFDRVQSVLMSRTRFRKREIEKKKDKYKSPLDYICKCSFCKCQIITDPTPKDDKRVYYYLRCTSGKRFTDVSWYEERYGQGTCIQPYYKEEEIVKVIDEEISKLWMDEHLMIWLEEELKAAKSGSQKISKQVLNSLNQRITKLKNRKDTLAIMRADGEITKEHFIDLTTQTLEEIKAVEGQIEEASLASINVEDEIEITLDLMDKLKRKWKDFTLSEKVEVLRIMTKKIELGKGTKDDPRKERKAVKIRWNMPWDMLIKFGDIKSHEGGGIEVPNENNWYARQDSNPRPSDS
jgi:DNA invertase Pin-like site-specific DNA recombinase